MTEVIKDSPIPEDAKRILHLLNEQNPALQLSKDCIDNRITFEGGPDPVQPGNLKAGAIMAALQAAIGGVASQITDVRYGQENKVKVNTDHAGFYLGYVMLFTAAGKGPREALALAPTWEGDGLSHAFSHAATAIYQTKDGRDFYLHGSLDARPLVTKIIGLDWNDERGSTKEGALKLLAEWVKQYTAQELEEIMVKNRECGSICYTSEEWAATEMSKALEARPLLDIRRYGDELGGKPVPPAAFPDVAAPAGKNMRALEGIKVVEMVRVIAGPTVGRTLAELGATVIKVNPPHLRDVSLFQFMLTTGVRTTALDIRKEEDRAALEELIGEADVFIDAFRPGSLLMHGYGEREVLRLARKHRGQEASIVYLHECCYGVEGPYANRPGWQQIADTASGECITQARSLRSKRAVLPPLPISDLSTGVVGALEVLIALRERATKGGSFSCVAALTRFNMFQISPEVGFYSPEVVKRVEEEFKWAPTLPESSVLGLLADIVTCWTKTRPEQLDHFKSPFFVQFQGNTPYGSATNLAPVAQLDKNPSYWSQGPRPYGHGNPTFA